MAIRIEKNNRAWLIYSLPCYWIAISDDNKKELRIGDTYLQLEGRL